MLIEGSQFRVSCVFFGFVVCGGLGIYRRARGTSRWSHVVASYPEDPPG